MTWDFTREKFFLKFLCYNQPLGGKQSEIISTLKDELNKKFAIKLSKDDVVLKINEFYDLSGLSALKLEKKQNKENIQDEVDGDDVELKQSKHVTIDEEQNKIFDSEVLPANESTTIKDSATLNQEEINESGLTAQVSKDYVMKPEGVNSINEAETKEVEPLQVETEETAIRKLEEITETGTKKPKTITDTIESEPINETENGEEGQNVDETSTMQVDNIAYEDKLGSFAEQEILKEEVKKEEAEELEQEKRSEEGEEEPAHLTRAQARKLQIDVEKEIEQNNKKTHDIEENRRLSLRSETKSDVETDGNTSTVLDSEADEREDPVKPIRSKRNSKIDDEITQRRSSRLRRKSEEDISEGILDVPIGKRTRANPVHSEADEKKEDRAKTTETPKKKGKRGKSTSVAAVSVEPETPKRKTRSKNVAGMTEGKNDAEAEDKSSAVEEDEDDDEDENEHNDDGEEEEGSGTEEEEKKLDERNRLEVKGEGEENGGDTESAGESESEGENRLRRSSRKRKSEIPDIASNKRAKTEASATPTPKRRGRKSKIESRENSAEIDDANTSYTRRSTRRRN